MKLYSVLILAIIFAENEAKTEKRFVNRRFINSDPNIHKRVAGLAKLIHLVSEGTVEKDVYEPEDERDEDSLKVQPITFAEKEAKTKNRFVKHRFATPDTNIHERVSGLAKLIHLVSEGTVEEDVSEPEDERVEDSSKVQPFDLNNVNEDNTNILKKIMGLIESNYDAHKAHESPGFRFHVISNPGVLADYKKKLTQKLSQHSSEDNSGMRRNAIFRFDSSSKETSNANDDIRVKTDILRSLESDKSYFNKKKSYDNGKIGKFDSGGRYDDDIKVKRKHDKENDDLKQDNVWDVITKAYNWDVKPKSRNKIADVLPRNKKARENAQQKKNMDQDFDNDMSKKIKNPEKSYDDRPKKDNFKEKPKRWDSGERKKPIKQKMEDLDRSYERPKNINKKKIKYIDRSIERSKPQKTKNKDWDNSPFKISTYITTKKWKKEPKVEWNKVYAPKDYGNPRPKKSRDSHNAGNIGFYGRTPIPYAGKRVVYSDK